MITQNLYEEALISPTKKLSANNLYVVSGYASATFANRHLAENKDFTLNLIIGMPGKRSDHIGYLTLLDRFKGRFNGYYLQGTPPVHSKVYAWYNDQSPKIGFSGSANYSQQGFFHKQQINQLSSENPILIKNFYENLMNRCVSIQDTYTDIKEIFTSSIICSGSVVSGGVLWEKASKRVRISFLSRNGSLPLRSGLNWGQREKREPNQAYLSLRKDARKEGFLPDLTETFTMITDDGKSFECVVAQDGRKAVHSTFNNSELGIYIRERIGVEKGALVTLDDLKSYGRTDYTLEKINEETFLLDLSVK